MSSLPSLSVVVCTRDRYESCAATVERLLEMLPADAEIIVVDQSKDATTRTAIAGLEGASRVTVRTSASRGLSAARNEGARIASGDVLLFTDDDCLPETEWATAWANCFDTEEGIGVGFGHVSCPPFDPAKGYTAGFNTRPGRHGIELFRLGAGHVGMGANMAVPKYVWRELGGFDEGLGAGSRFAAGEDADIAYRAARAGLVIRHLATARVWHYGYRSGASASRLMRGYAAGIAAMYAKHARCGDLVAVGLLSRELRHHAGGVIQRAMTRTRPLGLMGLVYFMRGAGSAWLSPLDARRGLYLSKDAVDAA